MTNARIKASDRRPVEEIDAIMVKYSAWASSRAADPLRRMESGTSPIPALFTPATPGARSARHRPPYRRVQPSPALCQKVCSEIQPANRVVSLSVRLPAEECALVRMRAAESRLSVSAYVRQCLLDVDAMRAFVEKISAELHATAATDPFTTEPAQLHTSAIAAPRHSPNFIARCRNAVRRLFSHSKK